MKVIESDLFRSLSAFFVFVVMVQVRHLSRHRKIISTSVKKDFERGGDVERAEIVLSGNLVSFV